MNITRTISIRPRQGGTFDFILQSRDGYSHAALTMLPKLAEDKIQSIITDALNEIITIISANTDWDKIGK